MHTAKDQTGRAVDIPQNPRRIISLVPSQTELLHDLGLDSEVIGITKFCVHPGNWFRRKTKVGGTKRLKLEKIRELKPDLIIANKEENTKAQIETLAQDFPVWVSNIKNLNDALSMIKSVGHLVDRKTQADEIIHSIKSEFRLLKPKKPFPEVTYLIWQKPLMTIGGDTFINSMLNAAGLINQFASNLRYPETSMEYLKENTKILFLSSEPFPFAEKHLRNFQAELPKAKVMLVDGQLFSWYGSRLLKAPAYFTKVGELL